MAIAHEVYFVDANIPGGELAGEIPTPDLTPTAEMIGIAVLPQAGLYFAARDTRSPSQIAKAQLDAEDAERPTTWTSAAAETIAQRRQEAQERAAQRDTEDR